MAADPYYKIAYDHAVATLQIATQQYEAARIQMSINQAGQYCALWDMAYHKLQMLGIQEGDPIIIDFADHAGYQARYVGLRHNTDEPVLYQAKLKSGKYGKFIARMHPSMLEFTRKQQK